MRIHRACVAALPVLFVSALFAQTTNLTEKYKPVADKLIDASLADEEGYKRLTYLCYRIGNRLSGSPGLEKAIAWSAQQMKEAGLENVQVIPTKVPHGCVGRNRRAWSLRWRRSCTCWGWG